MGQGSNDAAKKDAQTMLRKGTLLWHGKCRNAHDESTAFGSKVDETTANLSHPNQLASRTTNIREQGGRTVPGEVAILCQEVVEV
eukprot:scaffold28303_cov67-Skeletonema_dohrnii-CCMP3373.AAC.2